MSRQAQAEMGLEEAEAIVARGLAELPEVVSVHYKANHDEWDLVVVHDYGEGEDDIGKISGQVIGFEGRVPHLFLSPLVVSASEEARGNFSAGMKEIYRRK